MRSLSLEEAADYLANAEIERTVDAGHAVVNFGRNELGVRFVLVNDHRGNTTVTESL